MPTYTWGCGVCERTVEQFLSISHYCNHPPSFVCCGEPMTRTLQPAMLMHTNDASYIGLKASDGTPIDTRAKHRAYMRERGVTTIDDFKETWKREAQQRAARMQGEDPSRRHDIANAITQLEQQGGRRTPERFADD